MPQDRHGNEVARVTARGTGQFAAGETDKICRPGARSAPEASTAKVCTVRRRSLTRPPLSPHIDCDAHAPACALQSGSTARQPRAVQAPRVHTHARHTFQLHGIPAQSYSPAANRGLPLIMGQGSRKQRKANPRNRRKPPATGENRQEPKPQAEKIVRPEGFEPPTF